MPWRFTNLLKKLLKIMSRLFNVLCSFLLMSLTACTASNPKPYIPATSSVEQAPSPNHNKISKTTHISHHEIQGQASWYALTAHGMRTESGEIYDLYGLTAAHASLPFSTPISVTHLQTGEQVIVTVNDRLSEQSEQNVLVKLSYQAAHQIGLLKYPSAQVKIQSLPRNHLFPSRLEKRE